MLTKHHGILLNRTSHNSDDWVRECTFYPTDMRGSSGSKLKLCQLISSIKYQISQDIGFALRIVVSLFIRQTSQAIPPLTK